MRRSLHTPDSSDRVAPMIAAFLELLAASEKSAAEEGRDIVLSMLVVGLVFVAVAVLGDLYARGARKRHNNSGH
jgi:heme/copper-type cytochrome/quinol oxidase subunit 2